MTSIERLTQMDAVARLRARDTSLFSTDPAVEADVANRLGWTDLAEQAPAVRETVDRIAEQAQADDIESVVLLGMGGSSLASMVLASVFPEQRAKLYTLDTVSPITVAAVLEAIDPQTTLVLVSSKSGGTIEPNALYAVFRKHFDDALAEKAGSHFIAITDPGSSLERLAHDTGFGAVVPAPPTVGGRFSALTTFGLVPAALMGVDLDAFIAAGRAMEDECGAPVDRNPAAQLAAFIGDAHAYGRDKLTIVASPLFSHFGLWVEQLVAESTGKHGTGIIPINELATTTPTYHSPDRAVVVVRETGDRSLAEWADAQRGMLPVHEIIVDGPYGLAAEFVRWEYAVALVGVLLGVNPFDEPNVSEAKEKTAAVLEQRVSAPEPQVRLDGIKVTYAGALKAPDHGERSLATALGHITESLQAGDYVAVLAYLPDDDSLLRPLAEAVPAFSSHIGAAVALELGPRYLHSTGQLHKGGPNSGIFILVTNRDEADVEVPGQPWNLLDLHRAQAEGDLATLEAHDRRAIHVDLPDASAKSVELLASALLDSVGVVRQG
jgi:glucose-6-phosphate isomerase